MLKRQDKTTTILFRLISVFCAALAGCTLANGETVSSDITASQLNDIIREAPVGGRIDLEAGDYRFDETIIIKRDDITIAGAGEGKTRIFFTLDEGGDFFHISGTRTKKTVRIVENAPAGSKIITLKRSRHVKPGDALHLYRPNTRSYLSRNEWDNVSFKEAEKRPFRESVHRVVAVDGKRVTLARELPFNFKADVSKAQELDMLTGVSISGLTISSTLGPAKPAKFTNPIERYEGDAALRATRTQGLEISDLRIINSPSSALVMETVLGSEVEDIHIDGAHNKGGGGNGYGVELHEAFHNDLSGLTILNMRHAVIFSAWHAEVGNDIHVERTNRDINFHGSVDHSNTVDVDRIRLKYSARNSAKVRKNVWRTLSPGGTNHAQTDFLEVNDVTMSVGAGSWRNDTLVAHDDGATLTGGFGADRFLIGDGFDVITDFTAKGGDIIVFPDNVSRDDVSFRRAGDDLVVFTNGDRTVVLEDFPRSRVAEKRMRFAAQ